MKTITKAAGLLLSGIVLNAAAYAQDNNEIPVHDLGDREIGQNYPLKLTAKNINCENPQDFEFEIENMPWLNIPGEPIVHQLGPGQSKTIQSTMDFQFTPAGTYFGRVTSRCITCGWFVFATCIDHGQDVVMKVTVVDPNSNQQPRNARNPYAGMQPEISFSVETVDPLDRDLRRHLDKEQRDKLDQARATVEKAEKDGQVAQDKLRVAQKVKSDCKRKLARLKADADAAKDAAETAKDAAKDANKAADKAAKNLKNFAKDNKRALTRIKNSGDAVIIQKKVLTISARDHGVGSDHHSRAEGYLKDAQDKHFDTLREHTALQKEQELRKKNAKDTADAAKAADTKSKNADTAAKNAKSAYETQLKICEGRADVVDTAQDDVTDAKKDAKDAIDARNDAEVKAAGQAAENIEDELKKKRKHCNNLRKQQQAEIKRFKEAMKIGGKLKILDGEGGAATSAKLKEVNEKIWDEAQDMMQDATVITVDSEGHRGIANDETADLNSKDTAEDLADRVIAGLNWIGQGVKDLTKVGGSGPDVGQSQMVGGLKALGLAVQNQINALRNPNTYAAQRNQMLAETPYMIGEIEDMGHSREEAGKIYETIKVLHGDRNYMDKLVKRHVGEAARCINDIKKLEAKLARAKSRAKQ